jgi:glyoxylase-like metal-dependent hydrolase (beta-lactamase superfamily II)
MQARMLAPDGELGDGELTVPSNVLLLRGASQTVLIDAGSGSLTVDWPGGEADLTGALAEAGCDPAEIGLVVMTHLDFDHCGGAAELPRARVAMLAGAEPSSESAERLVEQLEAGGRIDRVQDGGSPAPGLTLRSAPGHRAGHAVVEVGGGLVHLADVIHHPAHVEHLTWDREFDSDAALALATRRSLMGEMADRGVTVVASHIAEPGRIVRSADGGLLWQDA